MGVRSRSIRQIKYSRVFLCERSYLRGKRLKLRGKWAQNPGRSSFAAKFIHLSHSLTHSHGSFTYPLVRSLSHSFSAPVERAINNSRRTRGQLCMTPLALFDKGTFYGASLPRDTILSCSSRAGKARSPEEAATVVASSQMQWAGGLNFAVHLTTGWCKIHASFEPCAKKNSPLANQEKAQALM